MNQTDTKKQNKGGILSAIVDTFLDSKTTVIFVLLSLCLGIASVFITPREEDPQIIVPLADVYVHFPGASAREVENLVATPLEKLLWQIDGVEYVYSMSQRNMAVVTVRYFVGENVEDSLVRLHNKINMNIDKVPAGVTGWVIKPISIDDVPIVNLTLHSEKYDDHELRRIGEEVLSRLDNIEDISRTEIVGGRRREVRVELDLQRLQGVNLSPVEVHKALQSADSSISAGSFAQLNRTFAVSSDSFLGSVGELESLVIGVHNGKPVYLRDVATVIDGPEEATNYSRILFSDRYAGANDLSVAEQSAPAVTLALAKKKGTNAVWVADSILERVEELRGFVIPDDVSVEVSRNYGETAQEKVNDLLISLTFAIVTVVGLIAFTMGWREGLVVAVSVPVTFSLCLFVNYLAGYTINRVTLFALILSLGLVVDDPITNVDNIQRHIRLGLRRPKKATLFAVSEVLPPVIMSTLTIIVSFVPMFFITGMMGPYMGPMAVNVPLAVTFSTVSALCVVPFVAYNLLKKLAPETTGAPDSAKNVTPAWISKTYRFIVTPFLDSKGWRSLLFIVVLVLLGFSLALALKRQVPLKMLPFDNKSELQIVIDMDEGTPLEQTDRVTKAIEEYLKGVPEVTHLVSYTGTASPIDFNGLVRHYYMRQGEHMADIRVILANKNIRRQQSHEIALRLRDDIIAIGKEYNALVKLVEPPPGPPVISTIVAELYGMPGKTYQEIIEAAQNVKALFAAEPNVVDIDDSVEKARKRIDFIIDKEKSALHGITSDVILKTLTLVLSGSSPASVHLEEERNQLRINLILPRHERAGIENLSRIPMKTVDGGLVELAELGKFEYVDEDMTIYHKNLEPVVYVFGETAGRAPGEAILDMQKKYTQHQPLEGFIVDWAGEGEWKITIRVFRDLGIAFGAALVGMYLLLIIQTGSYFIPMIIMMAIPLTLIGIMPGFWLLNLIKDVPIGGYGNPVFFTATSMIGMIALGGIVVRNSIVLIEFIDDAVRQGMSFRDAILESGAVRMRPILLTALTTAMGAWPITLDPIFSGLAWALIFGLFASTLFTLVIVPVAYYQARK